jgi:putative holliday junction resolvase
VDPTPTDARPDRRRGVRIGIDVGDVRIGVARSDPDGLIATPEATYQARSTPTERILDLAVDVAAIEVVVGLPRTLSGTRGRAADKAVAFAGDARRCGCRSRCFGTGVPGR